MAEVLAAAAAAGRESELAGEQAAVAAFRSARLADDVPAQTEPVRRFAGALTVKIAAAAAVILTAGGVAVAAVSGNLPGQQEDSKPVVATTSATTTQGSSQARSGGKRGGESGEAQPPKKDDDKNTPSPSLEGLCTAALTGNKAEHGNALDNPAFGALIAAAGGKEQVPAFCENLLATKKQNAPASDEQGKGNGSAKDNAPGPPDNRGQQKKSETTTHTGNGNGPNSQQPQGNEKKPGH
ncbi:hypothetical protein [Actinocrispum sp. NPDC049592]|uniref:hypothetical protein n=1 Tax=Actinocrispum sp. NPDC049592 TaxID=3154835 RepID=UPI003434AFDC